MDKEKVFNELIRNIKKERKWRAKKNIAEIYTRTIQELTEKENQYNAKLMELVDFESRKALDKQEMEILNSNPELQDMKNKISENR